MSDLLIFNQDDSLLAILSNEADGACPFWNAPFNEILNQGSTFQFTVPADHEDAKHVKEENQVAFTDKDGAFRLFSIREIDKSNGADGPQITAICEPAMLELNDEPLEDVRPYNTTAQNALSSALAGTRWQVGTVASLGQNSTNFYYISVTEAITKILNTWGGELRDRIEIDENNNIVGRYIDILPRRGADTGKIWEIDKDILSIRQKGQSYPKTALYGRGSSLETDEGGFTRKITFADVEWSVANGDPVDKPLGQEWVGDPEALQIHGRLNNDGTRRHRYGWYENGEQKDPAQLLLETWNDLQQQKRPLDNFEMDVFLLEDITGHEHEKVRLGDTTFAIDPSFAEPIEVEERVVAFEYDVADPDNTGKVELGQYINLYADDERIDKMEARINNMSGLVDKAVTPVTDGDIENIVPEQVVDVVATGLFKTIMLEWKFNNAIYIASYEVYASQVQDFTPDASNLIYRGKTSGIVHKAETDQQWYFRVRGVNTHGVAGVFSDEVTAQTIKAGVEDIAPKTITNELIAENAKIDFAKIANVRITNAMIDAVDATKIVAGTVDGLAITGGSFETTNTDDYVRIKDGRLVAGTGTRATTLEDGYIIIADHDGADDYTIIDTREISISNSSPNAEISIGINHDSGRAYLTSSQVALYNNLKPLDIRASLVDMAADLTIRGHDLRLGFGINDRGNTGESRAMVKAENGTLIINYNNDFWGGVAIQGGVWANGGYLLHDGPASEISTWDINGLKKTGFYRGNALVNAPTYDWLYLVVIRHDDNYVMQQAYDYWSNTTWIRHCDNGNWSAWSALAFANHNHDGRYVRIAGANDCWLEITDNNNLNLYRNGAYVRTV